MSLHKGHRERLRARFLKQGLSSFEEHNVLELLLFYARPRCDTNDLAHNLIAKFGSFDAVMDAEFSELVLAEGLGEASATLIKLVPELCSYYLNSKIEPGIVLDSTKKAGGFFLPKFFGKKNEELYIAALDDKKKVIRCSCIAENGIVNAVMVSVKKIVTEAVSTNATGIIMAHNHPGGLALPSLSDRKTTIQIYKALQLINVNLLDHLIIADGDFVSMADSGFLHEIKNKYSEHI